MPGLPARRDPVSQQTRVQTKHPIGWYTPESLKVKKFLDPCRSRRSNLSQSNRLWVPHACWSIIGYAFQFRTLRFGKSSMPASKPRCGLASTMAINLFLVFICLVCVWCVRQRATFRNCLPLHHMGSGDQAQGQTPLSAELSYCPIIYKFLLFPKVIQTMIKCECYIVTLYLPSQKCYWWQVTPFLGEIHFTFGIISDPLT